MRNVFTLVELLVVIAVITILAALLLPSLSNAKAISNRISCSSKMRQIGFLCAMYENDYNDWILPTCMTGTIYESTTLNATRRYWYRHLIVRMLNHPTWEFTDKLMLCPADTNYQQAYKTVITITNYAYNAQLGYSTDMATFDSNNPAVKISQIKNYSWRARLMDGTARSPCSFDYTSSTRGEYIDFRHQRKSNVLYLDGHVEAQGWADIMKRAYFWWYDGTDY